MFSMTVSLSVLAVVDNRIVMILCASIIGLCTVVLLIAILRRLSRRMVKAIEESELGTYCSACGQTVSDIHEHVRKVHA